jgi:DNA polymerase-3 subunit beta
MIVNKKALKQAVETCKKWVPGHPSLHILKNIRVRCPVYGEPVTVQSTDIDTVCTVDPEAVDSERIDFLIDPKQLLQIIKNCPGDTITIRETTDNWYAVNDGMYKFASAADPEEWPDPPEWSPDEEFRTIHSGPLHRQIFAMPDGMHLKPHKQAVAFFSNGDICSVGKTGRELLWHRTEVRFPNRDGDDPFLVMKTDIKKLLSVAKKAPIGIARMGRNHACFQTKNVRLITRLLDGAFPQYEEIISERGLDRVTVETGSLAAALEQAAALNEIATFSFGAGLTLSAVNPDFGEVTTPKVVFTGGGFFRDVDILMNVNQILPNMKHMGEQVHIYLCSPERQVMFQPADNENMRYVTMPYKP